MSLLEILGGVDLWFNSYSFLLFFPIVIIVYYIFPRKKQTIWLLAASYFFYMCWDVRAVLLLLLSTIVTYTSALYTEKYSGGGIFGCQHNTKDHCICWYCIESGDFISC